MAQKGSEREERDREKKRERRHRQDGKAMRVFSNKQCSDGAERAEKLREKDRGKCG